MLAALSSAAQAVNAASIEKTMAQRKRGMGIHP
jgi:hypothetical protein